MSSAPLVRPEFAALVRSAGSLAADDDPTRVLPVVDALRPLLPGGGLRRGSTIVVAKPAATLQTPDRSRMSGPAVAEGGSPSTRDGRPGRVPVVIAEGLAPAGGFDRASVPPVGPQGAGPARQLDRLENRSGGATLRAAAPRAVAARSAPTPRWGSTSIMLALLAEASRSGAWCAVVGLPELGLQAAAELGVALDRLALVPNPNTKWTDVVAALIDGFDIVVTTTAQIDARAATRLSARARQRGCVLIPMGTWDTPDLILEPVQAQWLGIRPGHGRLKCRHLTVAAAGRGAATRPKQVDVWLPTPAGGIEPYADPAAAIAEGGAPDVPRGALAGEALGPSRQECGQRDARSAAGLRVVRG